MSKYSLIVNRPPSFTTGVDLGSYLFEKNYDGRAYLLRTPGSEYGAV